MTEGPWLVPEDVNVKLAVVDVFGEAKVVVKGKRALSPLDNNGLILFLVKPIRNPTLFGNYTVWPSKTRLDAVPKTKKSQFGA